MKTEANSTRAPTSAALAAYAIHPELTAAVEAVNESIAKAKKLREMVDEAAAKAARLEGEIGILQQQIADSEVEEALAEEGSSKPLRKAIETKKADLAAKEGDLRSAQLRVAALEKKAPEYDADVATKGAALQVEHRTWVESTKHVLSTEIAEAIKPLLDIVAKAQAVGWTHYRDFLDDILVPDPLSYSRFYRGALTASMLTSNRLKDQPAGPGGQAVADAIRLQIQPVEQALAAVSAYRPYQTLASRRKSPYVVKGWGSAYHDRVGSQELSGVDSPEPARAQQ